MNPKPLGCAPWRGLLWLLAWLLRPLRGVRSANLTNPHWPYIPSNAVPADTNQPTIYVEKRGLFWDVEVVWFDTRTVIKTPSMTLGQVRAYVERYPGAAVIWTERDE